MTIFAVSCGEVAHAQQLAKLHNQTTSQIQAVVADKNGNCEGWFQIPAGGTVQVRIETPSFYVFAKDTEGNFKIPTAEKISAILQPHHIPIHNTKRFKLLKLEDGAFRVSLEGEDQGSFAPHFLNQLGIGIPQTNTGPGRFYQIGREAQGDVHFKH